jgi:pimeloyl-ACP methyl ester carboxylesterase
MGKKLELAIAALNGLVGDHLARTDNGLATPMLLVHRGEPLPLERSAIAEALGHDAARVVVLVHGLMGTESVWELPDGSDYGSLLARDLGYSPLYVRYNSGRSIAHNGAELSRLLAALVELAPRPLERLLLLGHSMGGLVIRAACHSASLASQPWLPLATHAIYVGTPHLGAPLERAGRVLSKLIASVPDPVTRLVAQVADLRSDGIRDLGDADLRDEDRARRAPVLGLSDPAHPVPLVDGMRHLLVAGSVSADPRIAALFGDAIVPLESATDRRTPGGLQPREAHCDVKHLPGISHLGLAHDARVYEAIRSWCEEER